MPSSPSTNDKLWFELEDEEKHKSIFAVVDTIEQNTGWRFDQFVTFARYYLNRNLTSLEPSGIVGADASIPRDGRMTYNVVKMAVDAIAAKIAKQKPRVMFLTSEGNSEQQERAKNLTRYVDAVFADNRVYLEGHRVFLDACVYGTGVFKVYPDSDTKRVKVERINIKDILVDEVEASDGNPEQIHQRQYVPRHKLKKLFPKYADEIDACEEADSKDLTLADRVRVIESWKLPSLPGADDGVHCISIENCTLFSEPYKRNKFPFAWLRWSDPMVGFYGESLVNEIRDIQDRLTEVMETIVAGQRLMAIPRWFVSTATKLDENDLNDLVGSIVKYDGPAPVAGVAPGASPEQYQFARELFERAFECAGVSLLSATSKKPAGLESGKAMMVYSDIETERFNLTGQSYQDLFMQVADLAVDASKELFTGKSKVQLRDRDKYLGHAFWRDIDMERDRFQLEKYSTSFLPKEPAGQLQTVVDMVKAKMVPPEEAMALLDYPDTGHFYRKATAPLRVAEKLVTNILLHGKYTQPEPYMDLNILAKVAQERYLDALANDDPDISEANLERLRDFMDQIKELLQPAEAAAPQGPPPGAEVPPEAMPGEPMPGELPPEAAPMDPMMDPSMPN